MLPMHPPLPDPPCPLTQIVYEFLLRYVVSSDTDAKVAKRHIDQNFVVHLLDLFDSGGLLAELLAVGVWVNQ